MYMYMFFFPIFVSDVVLCFPSKQITVITVHASFKTQLSFGSNFSGCEPIYFWPKCLKWLNRCGAGSGRGTRSLSVELHEDDIWNEGFLDLNTLIDTNSQSSVRLQRSRLIMIVKSALL